MKKKTIITVVIVVLILAGGILAVKRAEKRDASAPVAKTYAMVVSTMKPELKEVTLTLPYLALVQNDEDVVVASKIAARIESLKPSGTDVSKGTVIVRLDNTSIESGVQSIKAQISAASTGLKNLQATHKRTLELLAVKGASIEQSEMEESKIAETEAKIEALNQSLNDIRNTQSYATITAPVSGIISKTMLNVGDMAMPGMPIAIISSNRGAYLKLSVPADLKVYGATINGQSYDAIALNSTFNSLAEYKIQVKNLNLMTGERVEVNVIVYNGKAVKLPFDAILNRNGKSYVFVKNNDKAVATEVSIIQSGEDGAVISNNDLAGKEVVVEKQDILLKLLSGVALKSKEE
ncbi:MAG TPA: efflux RND transporter periplasmic adaptor subunit [Williamwhitmania sp.]|nr:efflux RND transporter periplasmic adaptor subunit [Williamwhitmania sp.]